MPSKRVRVVLDEKKVEELRRQWGTKTYSETVNKALAGVIEWRTGGTTPSPGEEPGKGRSSKKASKRSGRGKKGEGGSAT